MIKEKINREYLESMRTKDLNKKNLLSVIKGEFQNLEKNKKIEALSDEDAITIISKIAKSLKENIRLANDSESIEQLQILDEYLPKQLDEEILKEMVSKMVADNLTISQVMLAFKDINADKKLISTIYNKLKQI